MNTWLNILIRMSPLPSRPVNVPESDDWSRVGLEWGPLPSDYRELITVYGEGSFGDEIFLFSPQRLKELSERGDLTDLHRMLMEDRDVDVTFGVYPDDTEGLLGVAVDTYSGVVAWERKGCPDDWTVVFVGPFGFQRFQMGLVEFLVRILRNEIQCHWWRRFDNVSFSID